MIWLLLTFLLLPLFLLQLLLHRGSDARGIGVIQLAKIGDFVCSTPFLEALRQAKPEARIVVFVAPLTETLARALPWVDEVVVYDPAALKGIGGRLRWTATLRQQRLASVYCLNAGMAHALACFWAGIPHRLAIRPNFIGRAYRLACWLWSHTESHRADRQIIATQLALLGVEVTPGELPPKSVFPAVGAEAKVAALLSFTTPLALIGVGVSSGNKLKELSIETLVALIDALHHQDPGRMFVLIGTASDQAKASRIKAGVLCPGRIIFCCGNLSLDQLPALLAKLAVYVGVDSGVTYMADALDVPVVSVSGPCNMVETGPTGSNSKVIQHLPPCGPCAHIFRAPYRCVTGTLECIRSVSADEIAEAVEMVLSKSLESTNPSVATPPSVPLSSPPRGGRGQW